jgi:hypothetical protein
MPRRLALCHDISPRSRETIAPYRTGIGLENADNLIEVAWFPAKDFDVRHLPECLEPPCLLGCKPALATFQLDEEQARGLVVATWSDQHQVGEAFFAAVAAVRMITRPSEHPSEMTDLLEKHSL